MIEDKPIGGQIFPINLGEVIYSALSALPEEYYKNGRTSCYHHIISIIDSHMNTKLLDENL